MIQNKRIEDTFDYTHAKQNMQEYSDIAYDLYNKNKEDLIEPKINTKKNTDRIEWADTNTNIYNRTQSFAYPMYPYAKGGSLIPAGQR